MKKIKATIFILPLLFIFLSCQESRIYYVSSINGNDTNPGTAPNKAWASLDKVNQHIFGPGDKLLFEAGSVFEGQMVVQGSGTPTRPIVIDKYGEGKKPLLRGRGEKKYTVLFHNVQYWEVHNLAVTNRGLEREPGRRGVSIEARNFGDCHHIYLNKLDIHDVNGSLVKKKGGGSAIIWRNSGDSIKTRFVDLRIENCHLYNCGRNGINSSGNINREKWYPSKEVIIRNNLLEGIPGDGIVPIGCDSALIEYNVMRDCPDILPEGEAAAGIWPWSSDNTLIQFNEVSGHKAKWDGQGFDSDFNCIGTIIQYNYSHDNWGGFLLVCNNGFSYGSKGNIGTRNSIIRFNVSINDGIRPYETKRSGWFSPTMHISGPVENTRIYNNLIILPEKVQPDYDTPVVQMGDWGKKWPQKTWFANNIFYAPNRSGFVLKKSIQTSFTHNDYFGTFTKRPEDTFALTSDPLFVNVDVRGSGLETLKNFMLTKASPLIGAGIAVNTPGLNDLFGYPVNDNQMNIGIDQHTH